MFNWANGYKTVAGIVSGIAAFVVVVADALKDGFAIGDIKVILAGASALLIAIGLGSKAQRLLDALKK